MALKFAGAGRNNIKRWGDKVLTLFSCSRVIRGVDSQDNGTTIVF